MSSRIELPEQLGGSTQSLWHKSAPARLRREGGDSWTAWTDHLARRKRPIALVELWPGESSPLVWALPDGLKHDGAPAVLDREDVLLTWLADSAGSRPDVGYALEALAWCHALPRLVAIVSPEVWWDLLGHLMSTVTEADQIPPDDDPPVDQVLCGQLLCGELALTLAYLFPEIAPCRKLAREGRRVVSAGLVDLLDGQGFPHAEHFSLMRPLLACWTRCVALGDRMEKDSLTAAARLQYEWLVRQSLRLVRHDGTQVFSDVTWSDEALFREALRHGGDEGDYRLAAVVLPRGTGIGGTAIGNAEPADASALPDPALHSPWAAAAVLRPGWSRSGERLTVLYPRQSVQVELSCKRDVLLSGLWEWEIRHDGRPVEPSSDWEEVCWFSDDDVDYLELEIELTEGLRIQRQLVMAREDHFLLLADAVLGRKPGRLEYRGRLPLRPEISWEAADETREGFLVGHNKRRALVLPLALPEWRVDRRVGELERTERGLELCQSSEGCSLYAPLFFDLDPRRIRRPLTWRQLTVAESLEIQPDDVAVGYRVMVGKAQWLIYRSLARRANRTLLGHNLSTEALVGRFTRTGEVEPLVEIE